jgi:hypothetical protein
LPDFVVPVPTLTMSVMLSSSWTFYSWLIEMNREKTNC